MQNIEKEVRGEGLWRENIGVVTMVNEGTSLCCIYPKLPAGEEGVDRACFAGVGKDYKEKGVQEKLTWWRIRPEHITGKNGKLKMHYYTYIEKESQY